MGRRVYATVAAKLGIGCWGRAFGPTRQPPCGHAAGSSALRTHLVRRCLARCSALRPEPRRLGRLALEIGLEDPAQVGDLRGFVGVLGSAWAARGGVDLIKSASAELPNAVCAPTATYLVVGRLYEGLAF